jgi:hypothetical protein
MKLNPVDVVEFEAIVRTCAGKVNLITAEGDLLIANGILTAIIGLDPFFKVAENQEIHIACENDDDRQRIEQFIARYATL